MPSRIGANAAKVALTLILCFQANHLLAGSKDDCVKMYDFKRGGQCNSTLSTSMRIKNSCSEPVDMQYCLRRSNGSWSCGVAFKVKQDDSTSWYVCDGDGIGRYDLSARQPGSGEKFSTPK